MRRSARAVQRVTTLSAAGSGGWWSLRLEARKLPCLAGGGWVAAQRKPGGQRGGPAASTRAACRRRRKPALTERPCPRAAKIATLTAAGLGRRRFKPGDDLGGGREPVRCRASQVIMCGSRNARSSLARTSWVIAPNAQSARDAATSPPPVRSPSRLVTWAAAMHGRQFLFDGGNARRAVIAA